MKNPGRWILSLVLVLAGAGSWAGESDKAVALDGKKQLFLDDYLIESVTNVARVIHPARKYAGNPVLWDATVYGTVMRDEGRYRMWYQDRLGVSYAESQDGIAWTKPLLDIVTVGGQKTNALIPGRTRTPGIESQVDFPYFAELFGVEKDPRDQDAARRYKMGFLDVDREYRGPHEDPFHKGSRRAFAVATSPDGLHWKVFDNWATDAICDGGTHFMFDRQSNRYLLYGRTKLIAPEVMRAWGMRGVPELPMSPDLHEFVKKTVWGRAVARVESPDFLHWNITEPTKAPVVMTADVQEDPPGSEIYALMVFQYESVYIGLIKVWHRTPEGGPLDIDLAVSRDGVHFTRVGDRKPFIAVGDVGEWDRFNNSVSNNLPIEVGDQLRFYYSGRTGRHEPYTGKDTGSIGSGVGFATIPRDRFVSLVSSFDGGRIVTKPVRLAGGTLHLNAKSDFGEIVVRILDTAGNVLSVSKPVRRDGLDITIDWGKAKRYRLKDSGCPWNHPEECPSVRDLVQLRVSQVKCWGIGRSTLWNEH